MRGEESFGQSGDRSERSTTPAPMQHRRRSAPALLTDEEKTSLDTARRNQAEISRRLLQSDD